MTITVTETPAVRVLRAHGEIDLLTAPALQAEVDGFVKDTSAVVLDLSEVELLDSSGIRFIDDLVRACAGSSVGFRVVAARGTLTRRVLEIVSFDALVDDDLDAARVTLGL